MRKSYIFILAAVIGLSSCEFLNPFGEETDQEAKQNVTGEWLFEKSETEGNVHYPTEQEHGDKLVLRADDSFTCVEKGREVNGDWEFYTHRNKNTISLMENGSWECIEYRVESVDEQKLVYTYRSEDHCGPRTTVTLVSATPDPTSQE